jgi:curli biogenesis system outer membrane secretion channel CsgG
MMNRCFFFGLLGFLPFAIAGQALADAKPEVGQLRYTITVQKFENRSGWRGKWDIGDAWGAVLTDMLNQSGRFIVLGESDMRQAAMAEQDFAASGRTAGGRTAPVTGQMTPAQLLVKGVITHVQETTGGGSGRLSVGPVRVGGRGGKGEINATVYVVDSTTGQVLASQSVVGESGRRGLAFGYSGDGWSGDVDGFKADNVGKAVEAACADAVDFVITQLPGISWTGTVVDVQNGRVIINRGTREGVVADQAFVVGEASVLRDPDTGEVLDEYLDEVARLKVSQVRERIAICTVTSGDASAVQRGMAVHLP